MSALCGKCAVPIQHAHDAFVLATYSRRVISECKNASVKFRHDHSAYKIGRSPTTIDGRVSQTTFVSADSEMSVRANFDRVAGVRSTREKRALRNSSAVS